MGIGGGGGEGPVNLCYTTYIKAKKIKQAFYNYKAQKPHFKAQKEK